MSGQAQQWGRYLLLERLGEGGMGLVYKAQDPLGRTVALKTMRPELRDQPELLKRFQREARVAASLDHPNIVTVFEVGEHDGCHYLSMQFVEGMPLDGVLRAGRLPLQTVAKLISQAAAALDYAHRKGVVHRDIKPQNILIDQEQWLRITDFGIARLVDGSVYTATGFLVGTPEYMSPEQAEGHHVDGRSDIYSLGIVLYEMVTGMVPFHTPSPVSTALKHVQEAPPPPRQARPDLPPAVEQVIMRALAKHPAARYQTAAELARELTLALVVSPTYPPPPVTPPPPPSRPGADQAGGHPSPPQGYGPAHPPAHGPSDRAPAAARVAGPATSLMVVGVLMILSHILGIFLNLVGVASGGRENSALVSVFSGVLGLALGAVGMVLGGLVILGAVKMRALESYGLALAAAILAAVPCTSGYCALAGLPIGIWAIVVLVDNDVKGRFR